MYAKKLTHSASANLTGDVKRVVVSRDSFDKNGVFRNV